MIVIAGFTSCQKEDGIPTDSTPVAGGFLNGLPQKIVSRATEYFFTYNSDKLVTKIRRNPWYTNPGSVPSLDKIDSFFVYYNADKTVARSVSKHEEYSPGTTYLRTTRYARLFEYKANRLFKIYYKGPDVREWFEPYDQTYETQLGPISYFKINRIDSITYDSKGRISEVFKMNLERNFNPNPDDYYLVPINYKKITYIAANDSLIQQIISKPNITGSITAGFGASAYDSSFRNPIYSSLKMANFITDINLIPLGPENNSDDGIGPYLSMVPYLITGANVTITIRDSLKTYTCATYGFMGSGGFTFYY